MALTIPTIYTAIDKVTGPIQKMAAAITGFGNASVAAASRASRGFNQIGNAADSAYKKLNVLPKANSILGAAGISVGIAGATTLIGKFVNEAAKIEDAQARFQPIVGSADAARIAVQKLFDVGAKTPYEFGDVANVVANLLPTLNGDVDKAITLFNRFGDAAGGSVDRLTRISEGYNKALLKQKVTLESVSIIAEAGVPIYAAMAKTQFGSEKATNKLFEAISKGKVPLSTLEKAMISLTSKGGIFFGGMDIASKTWSGQLSTLMDTINQTFATIGDQALPILKEYQLKIIDAAGRAQEWAVANQDLIKAKVAEWIDKISNAFKWIVAHWDQIITGLKIYIGLLVVLKATSMAVALVTNIMAIATGTYTAVTKAAAFASEAWTVAQWALNAAMLANPIGLIIVGIAALIALVVVMIKNWEEWGAALSVVLGPLGMIISFAMSLYKNWKLVTDAFRNDGILGGIKAIGKVLLDAILAPLQQILEIAGNLPGKMGAWAQQGAANIEAFRNSMGMDTGRPEVAPIEAGFRGPVNPIRSQQMAMITGLKATQEVKVEVAAAPGTSATVKKNTGGKMPKTSSNRAQFGN